MNKVICVLGLLLGFTIGNYLILNNKYNKLNEDFINAYNLIVEQKLYINTLDQTLTSVQQTQYDNLTTEQMFRLASKTYGVDYKMLYAIARLETGNFTSGLCVNNNNYGGMKYNGEWLSYDSKLEGIMEMARLLKRNYIDYGLTTPELIAPKYCPNSDTWANQVRGLMAEVE